MAGHSNQEPAGSPGFNPFATRRETADEIKDALKARRKRKLETGLTEELPAAPPTGLMPALPAQPSAQDHAPTIPEILEEVRPAPKAARTAKVGRPAKRAREPIEVAEDIPEPECLLFRPIHRPPMAILCIIDDGGEDGEWVRIRAEHLSIGRTEGDVRIPHDPLISDRHAEIRRVLDQGRFRWYLRDLESTNGVYVRSGTALLKHKHEILLGSCRYYFDSAPQGAELPQEWGTRAWHELAPTDLIPALVEITPKGPGQRHLLSRSENWVGRDARTCNVVLPHDPLISPRHARVYRDPTGRWHIDNAKSQNGVWLRIDQMVIDGMCQFLLGEQRFLVKVL